MTGLGHALGCGPRRPLQELTAAKGRQHHNSRQNEWPQREVRTVFGAFRNVNVFSREPTDLVHI